MTSFVCWARRQQAQERRHKPRSAMGFGSFEVMPDVAPGWQPMSHEDVANVQRRFAEVSPNLTLAGSTQVLVLATNCLMI